MIESLIFGFTYASAIVGVTLWMVVCISPMVVLIHLANKKDWDFDLKHAGGGFAIAITLTLFLTFSSIHYALHNLVGG